MNNPSAHAAFSPYAPSPSRAYTLVTNNLFAPKWDGECPVADAFDRKEDAVAFAQLWYEEHANDEIAERGDILICLDRHVNRVEGA